MATKDPAGAPEIKPEEHVVDVAAKERWKKGNSLFEESKFAEAIAEYNEALKIDEKYADAYFNQCTHGARHKRFRGCKKRPGGSTETAA